MKKAIDFQLPLGQQIWLDLPEVILPKREATKRFILAHDFPEAEKEEFLQMLDISEV